MFLNNLTAVITNRTFKCCGYNQNRHKQQLLEAFISIFGNSYFPGYGLRKKCAKVAFYPQPLLSTVNGNGYPQRYQEVIT